MLDFKSRQIIEDYRKTLLPLQNNPAFFRKIALREIVKLFSFKGYCSVLAMTRWFSEENKKGKGGVVIDFYHTGNPPSWLQAGWKWHIESGDSIIEKAIYRNYRDTPIGFVTRNELIDKKTLDKQSLLTNVVGWLARAAGVKEMGYLWVHINENDFLVFCLRKKRYEQIFTPQERMLLIAFGREISFMRKVWYKQLSESLTEREIQVFDYKCQGIERKEIAKRLSVSINTVKKDLKDIYDKLLVAELNTKNIGKLDLNMSPSDVPAKLSKAKIEPFDWKLLNYKLHNPTMTLEEIADDLHETTGNISKYYSRIYKKLGAYKGIEVKNYQQAFNLLVDILYEE